MDALFGWLQSLLGWLHALCVALLGWFKDNKDALGGLQSLVTVAGTLVGAWWAIRRFGWTREGYARANVDASVACKRLDATATLVCVSAAIENKGTRRVSVRDGWVELQQVLPLAPGAATGAPLPKDGRRRVDWPQLGIYRFSNGLIETGNKQAKKETTQSDLDPGERDILTFEFVIPATVTVIKAWGYLADPQTGLGYPFEVLADVDEPSAPAAGAVYEP